jgi:PAS domain S-box-containing protein
MSLSIPPKTNRSLRPIPDVYRNLSLLLGAATSAMGLLGLSGWILGMPLLASIRSSYVPMAPVTSVSLMFLGGVLIVHAKWRSNRPAGILAAGLSALLAAYVLAELLADLGYPVPSPEEWIFPDPPMLGAIRTGRMSIVTEVLVLLSGAVAPMLFLRDREGARRTTFGDLTGCLGVLVLLGGSVILLSYLHSTPLLYGTSNIPMAAMSAFAFLLLGAGQIAASGPDGFPLRLFIGPSTRARLHRAFVSTTFGVLVGIDLMHIYARRFFFEGNAVMSSVSGMVVAAIAAALVGRVAFEVGDDMDRAEAARNRAEEEVRQSERKVRESRALLRMVVDGTPDAIFVKDLQGRYLLYNGAASRFTGKSAAEVIGNEDAALFSAEEAGNAVKSDREVLASGKTVTYEEHITTEGGRRTTFLATKGPLIDESGTVRGLFGIARDITDRKQAEEFREIGLEVLRILNEPCDLGDSILRVIETLKSRTGFDAVGIRLQVGDDFPYVGQDGFSGEFLLAENTLVERAADGGVCRNKDGSLRLECTCGLVLSGKADRTNPLATAGGSIWVNDSIPLLDLSPAEDPRYHPRNRCIHEGYASVALVPIRSRDRIVGLVQFNDRRKGCFSLHVVELLEGIASHVGEAMMRKRVEEENRNLERQVQVAQKMESLGVLAGGIAHDFNNILMAVLGNAELALDRISPLSPARGNLTDIATAARRAADLCLQMLAYAGKASFSLERVSLRDLVEEMAHLLKTAISKKAILNLNLGRDLPPIQADPSQIRQIVMNLLINASEAIGDRSGVITVSVGATRCDEEYLQKTDLHGELGPGLYLHLEVTDTGVGMDAETRARIFEPFFTTKFTGRGLGLAAVMGIVRSHKGALKVYSEPGKGTTFKILFPALEDKRTESRIHEVASLAEWRGKGTILLVDDEESLLALGAQMLEYLGLRVLTATDGREAVDLYRARGKEIDLVLMDLTMPHMDGAEAFGELRRLNPAGRIVLSSGYSPEDVASRFAGKGIDGVLQKPYTLLRLREALAGLLPKRQDGEGSPPRA